MRYASRGIWRQFGLGLCLWHRSYLDHVDDYGAFLLDSKPGVALACRACGFSLCHFGSCGTVVLRLEHLENCSRGLASHRDRWSSVLRNDHLENRARTDSEATPIDDAVRSIC